MAMPTDIGVIDTLIGFPSDFGETDDPDNFHEHIRYMFKDIPDEQDEPTAEDLLRRMDEHGVEVGLIPVHPATRWKSRPS